MFEITDYIDKKERGDLSVAKEGDLITIQFYEYNPKTGNRVGPYERKIYTSDLLALKQRLLKRIDSIDALILDAEKIKGG